MSVLELALDEFGRDLTILDRPRLQRFLTAVHQGFLERFRAQWPHASEVEGDARLQVLVQCISATYLLRIDELRRLREVLDAASKDHTMTPDEASAAAVKGTSIDSELPLLASRCCVAGVRAAYGCLTGQTLDTFVQDVVARALLDVELISDARVANPSAQSTMHEAFPLALRRDLHVPWVLSRFGAALSGIVTSTATLLNAARWSKSPRPVALVVDGAGGEVAVRTWLNALSHAVALPCSELERLCRADATIDDDIATFVNGLAQSATASGENVLLHVTCHRIGVSAFPSRACQHRLFTALRAASPECCPTVVFSTMASLEHIAPHVDHRYCTIVCATDSMVRSAGERIAIEHALLPLTSTWLDACYAAKCVTETDADQAVLKLYATSQETRGGLVVDPAVRAELRQKVTMAARERDSTVAEISHCVEVLRTLQPAVDSLRECRELVSAIQRDAGEEHITVGGFDVLGEFKKCAKNVTDETAHGAHKPLGHQRNGVSTDQIEKLRTGVQSVIRRLAQDLCGYARAADASVAHQHRHSEHHAPSQRDSHAVSPHFNALFVAAHRMTRRVSNASRGGLPADVQYYSPSHEDELSPLPAGAQESQSFVDMVEELCIKEIKRRRESAQTVSLSEAALQAAFERRAGSIRAQTFALTAVPTTALAPGTVEPPQSLDERDKSALRELTEWRRRQSEVLHRLVETVRDARACQVECIVAMRTLPRESLVDPDAVSRYVEDVHNALHGLQRASHNARIAEARLSPAHGALWRTHARLVHQRVVSLLRQAASGDANAKLSLKDASSVVLRDTAFLLSDAPPPFHSAAQADAGALRFDSAQLRRLVMSSDWNEQQHTDVPK
jgi:hypothetical protein